MSSPDLGVLDGEVLALLDHLGEIFERDVSARARIVEATVGVFLDHHRIVLCGHSASSQDFGRLRKQPITIARR